MTGPGVGTGLFPRPFSDIPYMGYAVPLTLLNQATGNHGYGSRGVSGLLDGCVGRIGSAR
jgi:hypothetical protein